MRVIKRERLYRLQLLSWAVGKRGHQRYFDVKEKCRFRENGLQSLYQSFYFKAESKVCRTKRFDNVRMFVSEMIQFSLYKTAGSQLLVHFNVWDPILFIFFLFVLSSKS